MSGENSQASKEGGKASDIGVWGEGAYVYYPHIHTYVYTNTFGICMFIIHAVIDL